MVARADAIAWRDRWAAVNRQTTAETLRMSPADRLRALAVLRAFAAFRHVSSWPEDDDAGVRARWVRLRALGRGARAGR